MMIVKIESKIRKYQRGLSNKKNVKKNKLRNRKTTYSNCKSYD